MKWRAKRIGIAQIAVSVLFCLIALASFPANAKAAVGANKANSDSARLSATAPSQPFTISDSEQLRPNIPPIRNLPLSAAQIVFRIVLAGLILIFLLAGFGIWRWRKWRNRPWNIAFREMDSLTAIAAKQGSAGLHDELNQILRRYFSRRFGWRGLCRTTQELLEAANREPSLTAKQREKLSLILNAADCAKFAVRDISPAQMIPRETLLAESRELIKSSIPQRSAQKASKKLRKTGS